MDVEREKRSDGKAESGIQGKSQRRRKRKRWPWFVLGVCALLALLVILLPTILSLGPARRYVVSRINKRLNGQLEIKSWSLAWLSGFSFNGIKLTDAEANPVFQVASVSVPASVPSLLGATKRLGETEIRGLKANVDVYSDGTVNLAKLTAPAERPAPKKEDAQPGPPIPLGMDIVGKLVLRDGEVQISAAGKDRSLSIGDLDIAVDIKGLAKPISFDISAAVGDTKAPLTLSGEVQAIKNGVVDPAAIDAKVKLALKHFDLASVSDLAGQFGLPVDVSGSADADLDAQVRGTSEAKVQGTLDLSSLTASGGPLRSDKFALDRLNMRIDAEVADKDADINEFSLDSSLLKAKVAGTLSLPDSGLVPSGNVSAEAQVDIAAVAAQLPDTLSLRKGLAIESGSLALKSDITTDEKAANLALALRVEDLAASQQGRRISLNEPVLLALRATRDAKGPRLDSFELTSSFANATGQGSLEQLDFTLTSDLGAAMREIAKFVDVGDASASGTAKVGVNVSGAELTRKRIETSAELSEVSLSGFVSEPISLDRVQAHAAAFASLTPQYALEEISEVSAEVTSPLAEVSLSADRLRLTEDLPSVSGGHLRVKADLAEVTAFGRTLAVMPADLGLSGTADFSSNFSATNGILKAESLAVDLSAFEAALGGKRLRQPKVHIEGVAEAHPKQRRAALSQFVAKFSAGSLSIPQLDVPDWAKLPAGASCDIQGRFDVEKALASAQDFFVLPHGVGVKGQAELDLSVRAPGKQEQSVEVRTVLEPLQVVSPNAPTVDEKVALALTATLRPSPEELAIEAIEITSDMLKLNAAGSFRDWSGARNVNLAGEAAWDFDRVSPLAAALTGQPVEMRGRSAKPFNVKMSLAAADWREMIRNAVADAGTTIPILSIMGIEMEAVDVPIVVGDGHVRVNLRSRLNQGSVVVPADVDFRAAGDPILTLPPNTTLVSDVVISDLLANQVLARFSPLFSQCVVIGGKLGFVCNKLQAPLGAEASREASLEGVLRLQGLELASSGFLRPLLDLAGVGQAAISVPDADVSIVLKEGRIRQAPLKVQVMDYALVLSGTVGLDTTLDMFVDVPITKQMVGGGADVFELLKDEVIRVHVTGTASRPQVSQGVFKDNLSRLIKSAATKLLQKRGEDLLRDAIEDMIKTR